MSEEMSADTHQMLGQMIADLRRLNSLDDKMDQCIAICQSGHYRISSVERDVADHEVRIRKLELERRAEAAPTSERNWALGGVALFSAIAGNAALEVVKTNWDLLRALFAQQH